MHDMLTGAASDFDDLTGFAGEEFLQHRPDRLMVAMERRRIEPAVGFDRPAILAEFHYKLSHGSLALGRCSLETLLALFQFAGILFQYRLKKARNSAAMQPGGE
jgi:hypothetical protein